MPEISLKVDGVAHKLDVDGECSLWYTLRDNLEMHNPRFGCGLGQCGACTVLIDNRPVRSCLLPMNRAEGKNVVTSRGRRNTLIQCRTLSFRSKRFSAVTA